VLRWKWDKVSPRRLSLASRFNPADRRSLVNLKPGNRRNLERKLSPAGHREKMPQRPTKA
jgi:hypothetical protein